MAALKSLFSRLGRKMAMKPEQAELIAKIKFPCC
ncbi:hypothetical protein TRP8649_02054 [Pelagimonas phthalicica]|uniref:Uncharacterized protein n=1 Tax=Pelagimonas phthalicica TaxID=1037362 RepID=A0A238JDA3_9RHOB|nr:hypothetical protein CLV87_0020 [Pelagimonas phthalicica]SMX27942.1 hypothetical protein TRP8649_02054 [Pelagimonas phthalicica]